MANKEVIRDAEYSKHLKILQKNIAYIDSRNLPPNSTFWGLLPMDLVRLLVKLCPWTYRLVLVSTHFAWMNRDPVLGREIGVAPWDPEESKVYLHHKKEIRISTPFGNIKHHCWLNGQTPFPIPLRIGDFDFSHPETGKMTDQSIQIVFTEKEMSIQTLAWRIAIKDESYMGKCEYYSNIPDSVAAYTITDDDKVYYFADVPGLPISEDDITLVKRFVDFMIGLEDLSEPGERENIHRWYL